MIKHLQNTLLLLLLCLAVTPSFAQKKGKKKAKDIIIDAPATHETSIKSIEREARFIDAVKSRMLGNFQEAAARFSGILKEDPKNHAAAFQLCRIYYDTDQLDLAEKFAMQSIKIYPYIDWYHIFLAEIRAEKGNFIGAASVYQNMIKYFPEEYKYYYDWSFMLAKAGKLEESIAAFDELEKKIGVQDEVVLQKEALYIRLGQMGKAEKEVYKLIQKDSSQVHYYGILGELYEEFKEYDKAEEAYRKVLKLEPENPDGKMSLAQIFRKKGDEAAYKKNLSGLLADEKIDIDKKMQFFIPIIQGMTENDSTSSDNLLVLELSDIILETHPEDIKALTAKADVLYSMGKNAEAIEYYKQALDKPGPPLGIWLQLFTLCIENEDFKTMLEFGEKAIQANKDEGVFNFYKGLAATQLKEYSIAVETLQAGLEKRIPTEALRGQMLTSLGDASYEIKLYEKADSAYEKALEIDPNNAYVLNNYAYYLSVRKEKLDKAEKMSKKSNLLVENNAAFLDTYAWILYQKGAYAEALIWIEKAIAALENPNSAELFEHYGDILFKLGRVDDATQKWKKVIEIEPERTHVEEKIRLKKIVE